MRYQLRYIRAQRTRSSPGAKHDDSPPERARTNLLVPSGESLSAADAACSAETAARANLRPRPPLGAGPVAQWESVRFTRGRSLVRSQPGPPSARSGPVLLQRTSSTNSRIPWLSRSDGVERTTGYCVSSRRTRKVAIGREAFESASRISRHRIVLECALINGQRRGKGDQWQSAGY